MIFCRKAKRINAELKAKCEELARNDVMYLTQQEKKMILAAIELKFYKELITAPGTKYFIRELWRSLQEKLKRSIKENPSG